MGGHPRGTTLSLGVIPAKARSDEVILGKGNVNPQGVLPQEVGVILQWTGGRTRTRRIFVAQSGLNLIKFRTRSLSTRVFFLTQMCQIRSRRSKE